jgi:hypothetical protein
MQLYLVWMKKGIAIISLALYLIASCGIVINSHYCMKRVVAVRFFESKAKSCAKCGMDMDKDNRCCHDQVKVIKMANDQNKIPVVLYQLASLSIAAVPVSDFIVTPYFNTNDSRFFLNHSPPLLSEQDSYILHGVFRI